MLKNNLKIAWRNLVRTKWYSFINIAGLAIGMMVALLIGLWIKGELDFDHYHKNHERLAAVLSNIRIDGRTATYSAIPAPLAAALKRYSDDFKEVVITQGPDAHVLADGSKSLTQSGIWAQPAFPQMFTFSILKGSSAALTDPSSIMINRSLAKSLFGTGDPLNRTIRVDNRFNLKVGAVYEDLPENSSFAGVSFLLPWDNEANSNLTVTDWNAFRFPVYVLLNDHASADKVSARIKDIAAPHVKGGKYASVFIQPMDRWHLYDAFKDGKPSGGNIQTIWMFGIIAAFVLLLACINFMNLSTARNEKRAKEVGIRKTIGSGRGKLITQFLSESLMMTFISFILALVMSEGLLPFFNFLADSQMVIPWRNPLCWVSLFGFTIFTGLLSGSYPAFYLSSFEPMRVLKGNLQIGKFASLPRKVLVVLQFTVSIALIVGTMIVFRQIKFGKSRETGYNNRGLLMTKINTPNLKGHYAALRNDLLQSGAVENMAECSGPITTLQNEWFGYDWKGRNPHAVPLIGTEAVTHDFGSTVGWKISAGRDFSRSFPTDSGGMILNETAVQYMGFQNPVGEIITRHGQSYRVIGVVKDMLMESPYDPIKPTVFILDYGWTNNIYLKIKPSVPVREALDKIAMVFKHYDPASPFTYQFTDKSYADKFYREDHTVRLAGSFALLTIFISCLGLAGLASYVAEQRRKEIGIRKVLGATVFSLWKLLSGEFIGLVTISCLIAAPLAWYFLHQWLQKYEFRATVPWWIFVAAGSAALLITLFTVSLQAIKTALVNPVNSLRQDWISCNGFSTEAR